jgi:thiol-disulfide isomerase/thioredoxin
MKRIVFISMIGLFLLTACGAKEPPVSAVVPPAPPVVTQPPAPATFNETPVAPTPAPPPAPVMAEVTPIFTGRLLAGDLAKSPLLEFNQADYAQALKTDQLIVLYFYADWCPLCLAETETALYPVFNQLTDSKVTGFRVNFKDSATDEAEESLARQFGIAYQHTKVLVKNGRSVLKSPATWIQADYQQQINVHL